MNTILHDRVVTLLSETLQIPRQEIGGDLQFGDLPQWDSMGHMDVMLRLETDYGIALDGDTISALTSLSAICKYLEEHGHA